MNIDLKDKIALVTGSDRNTGTVIAGELTAAGATMVIHSNTDRNSAEQTANEIGAQYWISGDLATDAGSMEALGQLRDQGVTVDILVNNYGTAGPGRWDSASSEDWRDMYEKNVLSVARLVRELTPAMKERGWGRIVNLGTIGSHRPGHRMPHYYAAKGALATLGVSLCQELSGSGITVNTVSPGLIHTPDLEAGYRMKAEKKGWGEDWQDILAHIVDEDFPNPCGRIATREEVAALVVFLCSDQAAFINGQNIRIDGGAIAYV